MALMHWLAAPLLKVVPELHAAWAQPARDSTLLVHAEVIPGTLHEDALAQMAAAKELQAATGLLVSALPHADNRKTDEDTATKTLRMGTLPSRTSPPSLAPTFLRKACGSMGVALL
jgi:hypothetical protein